MLCSWICLAFASGSGQAQSNAGRVKTPAPARPVIESFAPTRAFATGSDSVTLVGTIRNSGLAPLPAGAWTARLYCLSGLDYTEGDTMPKLPALEPNAVVTFKWRVQPTSDSAPLVAALALESPGVMPDARVIGIQHLDSMPPGEHAAVPRVPSARAGDSESAIENAKVRVRVVTSQSSVPLLLVSCVSGGGWRRVGTVLPLAEVLSAEGGQRPWWEVFKLDDARASATKTMATLTLSGAIGLRWRATVELTIHQDSSAIDVHLLLSPLRPMKLSGVRLCPFYVGDGSFGAMSTEQLPPEPNGNGTVAAVRWGTLTAGTVWPTAPLFADWQTSPDTNVDGADYRLIGAEMKTPGPPVLLSPGALVTVRTRLFAFSPSATVNDARRVYLPAK